jgi:hypothetical protein
MPAQAGIQSWIESSAEMKGLRWIPAFAGMTTKSTLNALGLHSPDLTLIQRLKEDGP